MTTSDMSELTPLALAVLTALCASMDRTDRPATTRELCLLTGRRGAGSITYQLQQLAARGMVVHFDDASSRVWRPLRYPDGRPFLTRRQLIAEVARLRAALAQLLQEVPQEEQALWQVSEHTFDPELAAELHAMQLLAARALSALADDPESTPR